MHSKSFRLHLFLLTVLIVITLSLAVSLEQFDLKTADIENFEGDHKLLTLKGLEQFDGRESTPAYAAALGKIYDFTALARWRGGTHVRLHEAGEELTSDLLADSPHGEARLIRGEAVALLVITVSELGEHDGQNRNKIYVAAEGKVYDVSALRAWRAGDHTGIHEAGRDLTTELLLDSPHGKAALENAYVVGMKGITPSELLLFNGADGKKSFVAKNGRVYDVSYSEGWADAVEDLGLDHAGSELTRELLDYSLSLDLLDNIFVVGLLVFDNKELSRFDGIVETKAFVAFNGTVYDISSTETAPTIAGTDITAAVEADPTLLGILDEALPVGSMVNE